MQVVSKSPVLGRFLYCFISLCASRLCIQSYISDTRTSKILPVPDAIPVLRGRLQNID